MSADNYIFIDRDKNPIEVWSCVASESVESFETKSLEGQKCRLIGKTETLEEAIELAEKDGYSEYGISFELWAK